ncbi:hypothetical protein CK500_12595 [Halorubrum salipaludis]|uniref:Uncharacterized protein n=1 Tax=Halorubrum salipaludis TaxID=2032630 RepID=A0A2A2FDP5_9EURY|nr:MULTISPECIES: hypothetical protein [Halorubrum]PAU82960.1 hypothetical protein CK500_12595 [Halorubrum salipaludis]
MSTPASTRLASGRQVAGLMTGTVKAAAFWAAIAIPTAYPVLLYMGLEGTPGLLFVGLLFANALALALGHDYKR